MLPNTPSCIHLDGDETAVQGMQSVHELLHYLASRAPLVDKVAVVGTAPLVERAAGVVSV